jgi:hypothetical protein
MLQATIQVSAHSQELLDKILRAIGRLNARAIAGELSSAKDYVVDLETTPQDSADAAPVQANAPPSRWEPPTLGQRFAEVGREIDRHQNERHEALMRVAHYLLDRIECATELRPWKGAPAPSLEVVRLFPTFLACPALQKLVYSDRVWLANLLSPAALEEIEARFGKPWGRTADGCTQAILAMLAAVPPERHAEVPADLQRYLKPGTLPPIPVAPSPPVIATLDRTGVVQAPQVSDYAGAAFETTHEVSTQPQGLTYARDVAPKFGLLFRADRHAAKEVLDRFGVTRASDIQPADLAVALEQIQLALDAKGGL